MGQPFRSIMAASKNFLNSQVHRAGGAGNCRAAVCEDLLLAILPEKGPETLHFLFRQAFFICLGHLKKISFQMIVGMVCGPEEKKILGLPGTAQIGRV